MPKGRVSNGADVFSWLGGNHGLDQILVDADACPVKEEVYRVAYRREVPVRVVSNSYCACRPIRWSSGW